MNVYRTNPMRTRPDPASITEIGIQRLPGSAYPEPQTRGLPYGSLYLTFHGMQWPYMPATGKGSRFVLGLSGWGWVDTAYQKFAPWGDYTGLGTSKSTYWKQQARLVTRVTTGSSRASSPSNAWPSSSFTSSSSVDTPKATGSRPMTIRPSSTTTRCTASGCASRSTSTCCFSCAAVRVSARTAGHGRLTDTPRA